MVFAPREHISFNTAKIKKHGKTYEIVVDPDLALKYREGEKIPIEEIIKSDHIFYDANKGIMASEHELKEVFGTQDVYEIAKIILKEGEISLTSKHREEIRKKKLRKIIDIIHRNAVDPRTGLPHPVSRIEEAIKQAKVHINEFKSAEEQLNEIIKKLRLILPLKFSKKKVRVHIPSKYVGRAYSLVKKFGTVLKEDWLNDGSYICEIELPGGMLNDFIDQMNNFTHGEVDIKILEEV